MKTLLLIVVLTSFTAVAGPTEKKIPFNFNKAEVAKVIESYAKASGQKFVVDASVRGSVSIFTPGPVALNEAFALMSTAFATNQIAILEHDDTLVVMSSRNAQRSLVPTLTELPPLKPERMITMIFQLKHISADEVNKRLRILPSRDGELTPFEPTNKIVVTDWNSNIHRIAKIIGELDQPVTPEKSAAKK